MDITLNQKYGCRVYDSKMYRIWLALADKRARSIIPWAMIRIKIYVLVFEFKSNKNISFQYPNSFFADKHWYQVWFVGCHFHRKPAGVIQLIFIICIKTGNEISLTTFGVMPGDWGKLCPSPCDGRRPRCPFPLCGIAFSGSSPGVPIKKPSSTPVWGVWRAGSSSFESSSNSDSVRWAEMKAKNESSINWLQRNLVLLTRFFPRNLIDK